MNVTHTRRSSVYTIRLRYPNPAQVTALRGEIEQHTLIVDVGQESVSFRAADDTAARAVADAVLPGRLTESLTTGLGAHRRTVTP